MEWRGGQEGQWYDPKTGESMRPDVLNPKHLPHYDWRPWRHGPDWRFYRNGTLEPKI
jgi:hypothetical protein